jgi:NAD(P)-dependent dehydrogenase (short-subunit alcohol dehydrogenase family)
MSDELAYSATKGAIGAFTCGLAPAVAPRGITVNAVNPGPTDSGWITRQLRDVLLPRCPMGRLGTPSLDYSPEAVVGGEMVPQRLTGMTGGQAQPHPIGLLPDTATDLEQTEPQGVQLHPRDPPGG